LAGVGSGFDLFGEASGGELPECGCAVGLQDGQDAEVLPEFGERAEDSGLGDFFAELRGEVVCGEAGVFGLFAEEGVGVERERGDLGWAAGGGRLLPGLVAAEGEDIGEGERGGEEVWRLGADAGGVAEEIEGDGAAVEDEAGE
jgi:hypothetical protein